MWSLGIVTLQLLAADSERDCADLKEMTQRDLSVSLERDFFGLKPVSGLLSGRGKKFVGDCLRLDPSERPSAAQAEGHAWLIKSSRDATFFRKFESTLDSVSTIQNISRPMPLRIPCMLSRIGSGKALDRIATSPHFGGQNELTPEKDDALSLRTEKENEEAIGLAMRPSTLSRVSGKSTPMKQQTTDGRIGRENLRAVRARDRERHRDYLRRRMEALNVEPGTKIRDGMHLPLNTLDKLQRPEQNGTQRKQVLLELQRTNKLFLKK